MKDEFEREVCDMVKAAWSKNMYYESHVTIDPVLEHQKQFAMSIGNEYGFRLAELYMDKGVPNQKDAFFTARSNDSSYASIAIATHGFVHDLRKKGFVVRRYKIEQTIMDSKLMDELNLLGPTV